MKTTNSALEFSQFLSKISYTTHARNQQNAHRGNTESESEARILTKEDDEPIWTYITPLIKQLEDVTRLIQGVSSVHRKTFPQGRVPVLILAQPVTTSPTIMDLF